MILSLCRSCAERLALRDQWDAAPYSFSFCQKPDCSFTATTVLVACLEVDSLSVK